MNNQTKIVATIISLNMLLTFWLLYSYKNAPPLEENVAVRIGQSDRFIAENSNKLEQMRYEVNDLKSEVTKLKNFVNEQQNIIASHESLLRAGLKNKK